MHWFTLVAFDKQTVCGQEWKQENPDIIEQMTDGTLGRGFSSEDAEKGPKSGSVLDTVVTELAVRWALRRRGKQGQLQGFRSEQLSTFY